MTRPAPWLIVAALAVVGASVNWPAPGPIDRGELASGIVRLMDEHISRLGFTLITDEICPLVTETYLLEAAAELPELSPQTWTAGMGHPLAPSGSLRADFSRNAQFLRNQHLLIFVSDEHDYCEAKIENVSGL